MDSWDSKDSRDSKRADRTWSERAWVRPCGSSGSRFRSAVRAAVGTDAHIARDPPVGRSSPRIAAVRCRAESNPGASRHGVAILSAMHPSGQGSGRGPRPRRDERGGAKRERPSDAPAGPRRRKSLGQHHLKDGRVCRPLVEFLHLEADPRVLEVGPGGGILTRELLGAGARVFAFELDVAWAFDLPRRARASLFGNDEPLALAIVAADALEIAWERLPPGMRVAGNLPYNVGTPIVERLLRGAPLGTRAAFLLQREVVDRIVARPGDDAYGALSILVALRARATRLGIVKPGAFVPPPKVDSAFVGFETVAPPLAPDALDGFERLVRFAFSKRRKSLSNALAEGLGREPARAALAAAGVDPRRRAEELGLEELVALFHAARALDQSSEPGRPSEPE